MALYAITSPANKDEVMRRMGSTVALLRGGGIAPDYLEEVKNGLRFEHARSLTRNEYHAFNLAIEEALDLPYGNYRRLPQTLDAITLDQVVACSEKYFGHGLWLVSGGNND
jgi:predicted Zn-dependent peptidase